MFSMTSFELTEIWIENRWVLTDRGAQERQTPPLVLNQHFFFFFFKLAWETKFNNVLSFSLYSHGATHCSQSGYDDVARGVNTDSFSAEKRESLRAELERLKGNPAAQKKPSGAPELGSVSPSKGSITLQDLRLPLKADFVCSTANRPGRPISVSSKQIL